MKSVSILMTLGTQSDETEFRQDAELAQEYPEMLEAALNLTRI